MNQVGAALDEWKLKLEAHFSALALNRREAGLPVFAIEHGLNNAELSNITALLHQRLIRGEALGVYWLLWVVYASELGYDYDGEEYWPSFEKRTPHWRLDMHRRGQLRQWFIQFHKEYTGVSPTGPWANHFSIIAWPITHAVLPKDLQAQLARILYEQRYFVADFVDETPIQVGHLIAASAYDASSRLRIFLEQEELAGRIVLALLGAGERQVAGAILESTLHRIVSDLEVTRDARVWLREARSTVEKARIQLAAKARAHTGNRSNEVESKAVLERVESRDIQPRLVLVRESTESWAATIELPSFAGVAALNARYATFLRKTRCMVAGVGASWYPGGWLLFGTQKRRLISWPDPSKPLIKFEQSDNVMSHLLQADCRISEGPVWLFRINRDGTASEVIGCQVRPGHDYVLLHTAPVENHAYLQTSRVSCSSVDAEVLRIPRDAPGGALQGLSKLGLKVARTLRIWPVGLPPARWDGEGSAEWFTGDYPCIGMSHDGSCEGFSVLLDGQREAKTIAAPANQPVFLKFGQLSIGSHRLIVTPAYRNPELDAGSRRIGVQANLRILIRQPHRWIPGTSGHAGLIVTTDPYEPSLDALLEGRVRVSIYGPEGRTVACRLEFLDEAGKVLAFESLGNIRIPMPPNAWQSIIEEWAQKNSDPSNYLGASAGRLTVEAEGLGSSRIWLSHAHVPIRWLAKGGRNIELRLVDDTAQENPTTVEFASFRTPTSPAALIIEDLSQSITPDGNGGLYLAATGQYRAGVVVSVQRRVGRLQELAERPALQSTLTDRAEVASLLRWIRDWSMARVVGPLAAQRRSITVRGMQDQLFASVCGRRWYGAESGFRDLGAQGTGAREMLENAVSSNHVSFAIGLARARDEVLLASIESSARTLLAHTARHRICSDFNLCEAALRLAGTPAHFADWAGQQLDKLLDELRQFSALIRAARMLVLLADDDEKLRIEGWTQ